MTGRRAALRFSKLGENFPGNYISVCVRSVSVIPPLERPGDSAQVSDHVCRAAQADEHQNTDWSNYKRLDVFTGDKEIIIYL